MKETILIISILFIGKIAIGQTESEYYKNPIDTIFESKVLNEKREITVILPKSFCKENASKYPLIIIFDRQNKKIFREIFESINYLVSFVEMPESIIIGISTNTNRRYIESSFTASNENGKAEKMIDFLYKELIPWADNEYNCSNVNVFIGHSRFGYLSSYLLSHKMNDLTGVISCSPFFLQTNVNLVDSLKSSLEKTILNHTVYYRFITGDSISDSKDYALMKSYLEHSKKLENFNWKGMEFYNAQHMAVPGLGVMPSLLEIFDYWSDEMNKILSEKEVIFNRAEQEAFKQKMKTHYVDRIGLGIANINGIAYKYYNDKKYAEARLSWELLMEEYPIFTNSRIKIADTYAIENNKSEAIKNYKIAKQELNKYSFYSSQEKEELRNEIEEKLSKLEK